MDDKSWLSGMFQNPIADVVLIVGILAVIIILAILGKKGLLRVNMKGISIGNGEIERTICRQQVEHCKAVIDTFVESIGYTVENRYRARYISELALDVLMEAVLYNHIQATDFYIGCKVDKIWSIIMKYAKSPEYKTDEFKHRVSKEIAACIEHLVELRKYYTKENK